MQVVGDTLAVISVSNGRQIASIFPDVTTEESHQDTLTITEHPIQQGAPITDHAYKNPSEVTMRVAWSNCKEATDRKSINGVVIDSIADAYAYLLKLQASRQPFDVITGKRAYKNMLIKSLANTTDRKTNETLDIVVGFKQPNFVKTSTAKIEIANQSNPQVTVGVQNTGNKNPLPVTGNPFAKLQAVIAENRAARQ